jgi:hypothetical protein
MSSSAVPRQGRFVILEHTWDGVHWDLMLEDGESLRTWATDGPIEPGNWQPARPLPAHRRVYLDFEGPISGGRGEVRRWDAGEFRARIWTDTHVLAEVAGCQLVGVVELWVVGGSSSGDAGWAWRLTFREGNLDRST